MRSQVSQNTQTYPAIRKYKKVSTGSGTSIIPAQRIVKAPAVAVPKPKTSQKAGGVMLVSCLVLALMAVLLVPLLVGGASPSAAATASPVAAGAAAQQVVAYTSVEDAMATLGLQASLPSAVPEGTVLTAARVLDGTILELEYDVGGTTVLFRAAHGNEDISGSTKNYTYTTTEDVDGTARMYLGVTEQILNVSVWASNDVSYALVASAGLSADTMRQIAESI